MAFKHLKLHINMHNFIPFYDITTNYCDAFVDVTREPKSIEIHSNGLINVCHNWLRIL